jgi:hypothetical protein
LGELAYCNASPRDETEKALVADPVWLRIYLTHVIGNYTVTIKAGGPLPEWNPASLDNLEECLRVSRDDGTGWLIDCDRLTDLAHSDVAPKNEREALLVQNPEWLHFYLAHVNGVCPITIPASGPLPTLPSNPEELTRVLPIANGTAAT